MVFGIVALIALRLLLPSLIPVGAPSIPISFSSLPLPTIIGALLSIVVIAAVTEEIAFRGYMQKPMEDAYGIVPAVLIVGVMFWVAHLDHGISVTHLPFHVSASIALGLLVYLTRSLVPAMIAHGAGDLLLVPAYFFRKPEFVWKALSARPVWEGAASTLTERFQIAFGAMSPQHAFADGPFQIFAIAFLRLVRASRASAV